MIELLVVIAIIAILAAMLLPALSRAKLKATGAVCFSNQKQLALSFIMYADENSDQIIPQADYNSGGQQYYAGGFWGGSGGPNFPPVAGPAVWEQTAMKAWQDTAQSPLSKYAANPKVDVCPGDTRFQKISLPAGWAFGSYSKTENVGGEPWTGISGSTKFCGQGDTFRKYPSIKSTSDTFVFVEDLATAGKGFNQGTWCLQWNASSTSPGHSQSFQGIDPPGVYHGNVTEFSFADGHAEIHKWVTSSSGSFTPGTFDYNYLYNNYRFPAWQP